MVFFTFEVLNRNLESVHTLEKNKISIKKKNLHIVFIYMFDKIEEYFYKGLISKIHKK